MQPSHIEHIGIAVTSLDESIPFFETLLGTKCYAIEEVADQKVKTAFLRCGQTKIELLEPTSPESTIAAFIEKNGGKGGMHHIAFAMEDTDQALNDAKETGYGIVMPSVEELNLEDPEIIKQGGRYSVRMKASAPSIHMIRADVETTVSPIVGNEKQSEDMVNYLLQEFEGDTSKIWQSNIFGRSFNEIVSDDLQAKLKRMPDDARGKLQQTLERIINEGGGGLICIIL